MRIISGYLNGRNIDGYDIVGTRPTMARVRESMFAMIQDSIINSTCLDLFAGSGSLGIEAISNGSKCCYFVDNNKRVINILNKNIDNLKIRDKSVLLNMDYNEALNNFKKQEIKFDLIFLDPPYKLEVIEDILLKIDKYQLLNINGQVICEYSFDSLKDNYNNLNVIKRKHYGEKYVNIYINK